MLPGRSSGPSAHVTFGEALEVAPSPRKTNMRRTIAAPPVALLCAGRLDKPEDLFLETSAGRSTSVSLGVCDGWVAGRRAIVVGRPAALPPACLRRGARARAASSRPSYVLNKFALYVGVVIDEPLLL